MMIGRLLNAGCVSQARQLATLFEHDSPDLTIVLVTLINPHHCPSNLTIILISLIEPYPYHCPGHSNDIHVYTCINIVYDSYMKLQ